AASDQNLPVLQQRRPMPTLQREHSAGSGEASGGRIVELRRAPRISPGDQNSTVQQERGRMASSPRGHGACWNKRTDIRSVEFRGARGVSPSDQNSPVQQQRGRIAGSRLRHIRYLYEFPRSLRRQWRGVTKQEQQQEQLSPEGCPGPVAIRLHFFTFK